MKKLRVLLVEDSEDDAFLITRELRSGGFDAEIEQVRTRKMFTEALESSKEWDIILSDYSLPHYDGLRALTDARASEKGKKIPFIILSGSITEDTAVATMRAG